MSNYWKDKNVFITGFNGFIGSWLTAELCNKGAEVTGLIRDHIPNSNTKRLKLDKKMNIVNGDITNFDTIRRSLSEYDIDTVFHLAAQPIVTVALKDPISTFKVNIEGTWNILEASRLMGVKRVIVASSDKAYGTHKTLPYDETFSLKGEFPYDVSKSCADLITQTYYNTYRLPVCITRNANIYGGGDLNFNRIIPETIKNILLNKDPVIRSNGEFIREFFYVKDAVSSYLSVAENMHKKDIIGKAFNFGSDEKIKVIDLVNKIIQISGKKNLKPIILDEVKKEINDQYLSSKFSKSVLNWNHRYNLEEGLKETYHWYEEFFA
jgi:CDP-glucose 4,6-dehydratase